MNNFPKIETQRLVLDKLKLEDASLIAKYAQYLVQNEASGKVMQKAGMILEGTLKEHHLKDGVPRTVNQYRLLRSEFERFKN